VQIARIKFHFNLTNCCQQSSCEFSIFGDGLGQISLVTHGRGLMDLSRYDISHAANKSVN